MDKLLSAARPFFKDRPLRSQLAWDILSV